MKKPQLLLQSARHKDSHSICPSDMLIGSAHQVHPCLSRHLVALRRQKLPCPAQSEIIPIKNNLLAMMMATTFRIN